MIVTVTMLLYLLCSGYYMFTNIIIPLSFLGDILTSERYASDDEVKRCAGDGKRRRVRVTRAQRRSMYIIPKLSSRSCGGFSIGSDTVARQISPLVSVKDLNRELD